MQGAAILTHLVRQRVIPVAVIDSAEDAVPLARTLADAGLPIIEVTLRTSSALESIRAIRKACPEVMVGAGTILESSQIKEAITAGAHFGVSPGLNESVISVAAEMNWFFVPGVMTPSEIEKVLSLGCKLLKFFPADVAGGLKALKAFAGPYTHTGIRFIPLGGVSAENMNEYLALPIVAAIGGSWICTRELIREKQWGRIGKFAQTAVTKAASANK